MAMNSASPIQDQYTRDVSDAYGDHIGDGDAQGPGKPDEKRCPPVEGPAHFSEPVIPLGWRNYREHQYVSGSLVQCISGSLVNDCYYFNLFGAFRSHRPGLRSAQYVPVWLERPDRGSWTCFCSSGGGRTAFMPNDSIESSRPQPVLWYWDISKDPSRGRTITLSVGPAAGSSRRGDRRWRRRPERAGDSERERRRARR